MDQIFDIVNRNFFWFGVVTVAVLCSGFSMVRQIVISRAREKTRREIAAYIAEGSMTPEQGERLMNAGRNSMSGGSNT